MKSPAYVLAGCRAGGVWKLVGEFSVGLHYYNFYYCFEALGVSVSDADAFVGAYERKERSPLQPVEEGGFLWKDSGCSRYQVSVGVSYTLQVLIGESMF